MIEKLLDPSGDFTVFSIKNRIKDGIIAAKIALIEKAEKAEEAEKNEKALTKKILAEKKLEITAKNVKKNRTLTQATIKEG